MKSTTFAIFLTAILFQGCSTHMSDDLDEQLAENDNTYIYDIKLQNIIEPLDKKDQTFSSFPFVSQKMTNGFKGHFSPEFYAKNRSDLRTSSLDKVDIWSLELEPDLLDVIYTKAIWIEDYKDVSDDLFVNLCYTYNLSDGQQEILKDWIRKGGTFWVENGVYATGSEMGPKKRLSQKQRFLGRMVHTSYHTLDNMSNKRSIVFDDLQTSRAFSDIRSLQLDLTRAAQTFFIIDGESQIKDKIGQTMLSISTYGDGKIVSMLPFESYDAYRDGELLRWQLLKTLEEMQDKETSPQEEGSKVVAERSDIEQQTNKTAPQETVMTKGRSVQVFSYRNKAGAYEAMRKASGYALARVEKIGDFYVGRIGMYVSDNDARTDLRQLQGIFPGAYMRTCAYEVPVTSEGSAPNRTKISKYTLLTMDDTITHQAPVTVQEENKPVVKTVLTKGRCIQLFTYRNKAGAYKEIAKADDYTLARVEKNGSFYVGRVGMYASDSEAKEDLRRIQSAFPGAYMRTCVYKVPEHDQEAPSRTIAKSKEPVQSIRPPVTVAAVSEDTNITTPKEVPQKAVVRTKGRCIQLFSYRNKAGAYNDIKKAAGYRQVRVERPGSYYVGRVGMYGSDNEAKEDLKRLQKDFPGAYMRTCIYHSPKKEAVKSSKYTLKTMDDTIEREALPAAPKKSIAPKATVLTKGRCIQLFSYSSEDGAKQALEAASGFRDARIEKTGRYYSGRVGIYASDRDADEDLRNLRKSYPDAYMRTCIYTPNR